MRTITAQERQTKIYRKMSARKKLEIVDSFYRFGQRLQQDANPEVIIDLTEPVCKANGRK
ncbi:MAG: hypothetical protein US94_C0019G0002 [Berkelbacteria bacterium GW2011_GWB1_38_5]|uniref:Uncharacterized protein n=1 Tax=Berkelbacteria bacterium GW2011_GWB1_38_5 TaxID=1618336 RepID=A0A0G0N9Y7_9BACT|nr:MAG: hypothetical protein US94_C0019G0002 [Berkelbacteria bacterium GW2011_GWB1_38_5]